MKILVVDIETTGFKSDRDLIVEIGVVLLDLENGNMEVVFNQLVKEEGFCHNNAEAWVFENSDLMYEDVLHADPINKVALQELFSLHPVTAWNSDFDFRFLRSRGLIMTELDCPMKKSTDHFKIKRNGRNKWPSVQEAWDILFPDATYEEKHRGLDDAFHEAQIIYNLHQLGIYEITAEEIFDEN